MKDMDYYLAELNSAMAKVIETGKRLNDEITECNNCYMQLLGYTVGIKLSDLYDRLGGTSQGAEEQGRNVPAVQHLALPAPQVKTFTKKELLAMPKEFMLVFQNGTVTAHTRLRSDGYYEVRSTVNGHNYSGTGKSEDIATSRFIENLRKESPAIQGRGLKDVRFSDYIMTWLEAVKRPATKDVTYHSYEKAVELYLNPAFGQKRVSAVSQFDIQNFLNTFYEKGNYRTAQLCYQLLKAMYEYAAVDQIVKISPLAKIKFTRGEVTHGTALSRDEEKALVSRLETNPGDKLAQVYVFMLYTGIRRSEFKSVRISDGWVTIDCAKCRRGRPQQTRSIPVTPMLRKYLDMICIPNLTEYSADTLTKKFKEYSPNHHLHDLRHTFITRCQECGVKREIVSLWAGHAADTSVTTAVYTHLDQNKDLQTDAARLVDYEL